jgi:hypothetical protein
MLTISYRPPPRSKPKPGPTVVTVKEYQRSRCGLLLILTLGITGAIGAWLWQTGLQIVDNKQQILVRQRLLELEHSKPYQHWQELQQQNASLSLQNQELRTKLTALVQTTQHSQATYIDTLNSLSQALEENRELKEEASFYRILLTSPPTLNPKEVTVRLMLQLDEKSKNYLYNLVLAQWDKSVKATKGFGQLLLVNSSLTIEQAPVVPFEYDFSYFQRLKGHLPMPKFVPEQIIIRLWSADQKLSKEIQFNWQDLLTQE